MNKTFIAASQTPNTLPAITSSLNIGSITNNNNKNNTNVKQICGSHMETGKTLQEKQKEVYESKDCCLMDVVLTSYGDLQSLTHCHRQRKKEEEEAVIKQTDQTKPANEEETTNSSCCRRHHRHLLIVADYVSLQLGWW